MLTLGVSGAWADVTVTLADASQDPYNLGARSNSNKTFTSNAASGLAGLVLDVTGAIDHYSSGTYNGRLALKTSAASTDETWTLTAPEGYVIKGYSFSARFASSNTATITAGGTPYSISSSDYTVVSVSGLKVKSTSFTVNASAANWIAVGPFTVTLAKIDFVSLTFDKPGSATNNITVNVKDADGDAIPGVSASLESTSCTEFKTGSAAALSRTTNSVLAPNTGYGNAQGSTITYTFKVEGLPTTFTYNKAALDVYALTGGGAAQGNTGNTVREWTFDVETGAATDALTSFVSQSSNDICTVDDQDGGLYHKLWTMSGTDKVATDALYIKVTLTKTASDGCYAGIGEVQLYKPGATVQYVISDTNGTEVFASDTLNATEGDVITELPSAYQRAFCSYSAINRTMTAGENIVNVTVTYNLPFTVSTDFENATWYYATIRGSKYLRADESNKDASGRYSTNNTNERTDAYKWAFYGSPYSYFYIANKAQGEGKYLKAGSVPTFETIATPASTDAALWEAIENRAGFTLRSITGANRYINDAGSGGNLGYWDSSLGRTDAGGRWIIEEASVSDKAALGSAITTAQALVDNAGIPGYITAATATTLGSAISAAQGVYDDASGDYASAYNTLTAAIASAAVPANINYTPRTDVYYTLVNTRGAMVYDPTKNANVDATNDNAEYLWYWDTDANYNTSLSNSDVDDTDPNNLWGFIESEGHYYMYNVGKRQFATVGTGTYGSTWIFSDTPAYITLDDGIADEIVPPGVRVRATIATTSTSYTMSISTGYTGPIITYDANGDGGVPITFAASTYAIDDDVTAAVEALLEDLTPYRNALKDVIDAAEVMPIGSGLGQYASTSAYTSALSAANTTYANGEATKSELQTAMTTLEAAVDALPINLPQTGMFLRIKSVNTNRYLSGVQSNHSNATVNNMSFVETADNSTIFYFDGSQLIDYSTGIAENGKSVGSVGTTGTTYTFAESTHTNNQGKYRVLYNTNQYLYSWSERYYADNYSVDAAQCVFTIEEVGTLPVIIGSTTYATLCAPVALTIPANVQAYYISALTETEATLTEISTTIAANTPVILKATAAGTYNFTITTGGTNVSASNKLSGQTTALSVDAGEAYTLQQNIAGTAVGLFPKAAGTIAGFKAYLPISAFGSPVKGFTFTFENAVGIQTIDNGNMTSDHAVIYSPAGQRMSRVQKGVNIVNGKKVLVK